MTHRSKQIDALLTKIRNQTPGEDAELLGTLRGYFRLLANHSSRKEAEQAEDILVEMLHGIEQRRGKR